MHVVININDKIYKAILDGWWPNNFVSIRQLIANGTPLPKGHGRLIDADALVAKGDVTKSYLNIFAPTIIEADKEDENG